MRAVLLEVPHRQQRYPADCLAACAAMILGYIGILISYQRLLKLLRAKEFGTPSFNTRLLDQLGLVIIYKQGMLEELYSHLTSNRP